MKIGMVAKDDSEGSREEGDQRVRAGTLRGAQLAQIEIADERVHGREATARKEAQAQRKVAKATAGHAGRVAKQDTLQLRVLKAAMGTCMPLVKRKVRSMKEQLTMVKNCKRGVSVVRE